MTKSLDRLYDLLPVIHRKRDVEMGEPLRALLQVIAHEVNNVEGEIDQLYDDWFIETCQDWVVPYIGQLVGYTSNYSAGSPEIAGNSSRTKFLNARREVANTIQYRRRKGTTSLLEQLAFDLAGWTAHVVEFYMLLGRTQHMKFLRPERGCTADLHHGEALDRLGGPFEELGHTVDVRRPNSGLRVGRFNIPSVGLFVRRMRSYSVTRTPALCLEEIAPHCYTFSALGNDTRLYTALSNSAVPHGPLLLPDPIRRRAFEHRMLIEGVERGTASPVYYGEGLSLAIYAPDWPVRGAPQPIPARLVVPADLTGWTYRAKQNSVAVDPATGRIAFPPNQLPRKGVSVSYHYGFATEIGGGEYRRPLRRVTGASRYQVGPGALSTLNAAIDAWKKDSPVQAVIEINESGVLTEPFGMLDSSDSSGRRVPIELKPGQSLEIRAADGARPVLRLLDYQAESPDGLSFVLARGSRLDLDGLMVTGRPVHIEGAADALESIPPAETTAELNRAAEIESQPAALTEEKEREPAHSDWNQPTRIHIRHCTLVPGWSLSLNCDPKRPAEPSLELYNLQARVQIEHTVLGSIQVQQDEVLTDPLDLILRDSVLDATGWECDDPRCEALGGVNASFAHATTTVLRSTVIGHFYTHAVSLGENSIFYGEMRVARRQKGCLRFCYVTPTPRSRTPKRFNCQPDLVEKAVLDQYPTPGTEQQLLVQLEQDRVRPQFLSRRYGTDTYMQLANTCAEEIRRGAEDESEMGVYHDLYNPQRMSNLQTRLAEYTPAGMDIGVFIVN